MCEGCRLEELVLSSTENLSSDAIEAILQTPTRRRRSASLFPAHQFSSAMLQAIPRLPSARGLRMGDGRQCPGPIKMAPTTKIARPQEPRREKRRK